MILGSLVLGNMVFLPYSFAAPKTVPLKPTSSVKVMGRAKFVLQGAVMAVTADSLTLHVANTSKNAKLFDSKDKTITVGKKTKITKDARIITLKQINKGDTIKVFGVFDKKSGAITLVRWVKVVSK